MKLLRCPLNGPRNISEFVCWGEVIEQPDPEAADDAAWTDYLYFSNNTAGVVFEWWCHTPTSYWFIAERHTVSDDIVRTYTVDEFRAIERGGR